MSEQFKRFLRDASGASAAEYAMILAVVGLGVGAAFLALGGNLGAAGRNQSDVLCDTNVAADSPATACGS